MATRRYPGDDPRRKLPDYAVVTHRGKPDGELGHILVETPPGLTRRERLMLMRRFAAHLQAHADDYEKFWLRRRPGRRDQADDSGAPPRLVERRAVENQRGITPPPHTNAVARELGRLALRLGLLARGAPDWTALARACGVSSATLFAFIAREGRVDEETLFLMLDGILAVTSDLDPRYNILPLLLALGVLTHDDVEAAWHRWRACLMRAEFGDDPRSSD